jgi:hypothetical protein
MNMKEVGWEVAKKIHLTHVGTRGGLLSTLV